MFRTILTVLGTTHMSIATAPHGIVSPHVLSTQCSQSQPRLGHVYIKYSSWRYNAHIERGVHVHLCSVTATQRILRAGGHDGLRWTHECWVDRRAAVPPRVCPVAKVCLGAALGAPVGLRSVVSKITQPIFEITRPLRDFILPGTRAAVKK